MKREDNMVALIKTLKKMIYFSISTDLLIEIIFFVLYNK